MTSRADQTLRQTIPNASQAAQHQRAFLHEREVERALEFGFFWSSNSCCLRFSEFEDGDHGSRLPSILIDRCRTGKLVKDSKQVKSAYSFIVPKQHGQG
jgi:hypothetical protein